MIDFIGFANKYGLDKDYVSTVFGAYFTAKDRHVDRSVSPFYLYDENKAYEAVMYDIRMRKGAEA